MFFIIGIGLNLTTLNTNQLFKVVEEKLTNLSVGAPIQNISSNYNSRWQ